MLVLEDNAERMHYFKQYDKKLVHVETADDCIEKIKSDQINELWLDHDLGGEQYASSDRDDTGFGVVRFLVANDYTNSVKKIYIHSHNKFANSDMNKELKKSWI